MKRSMLLIHPTPKIQITQNSNNIFEQARTSQSLPSIHKSIVGNRQAKLYDFVGSTQFKKKKFFPQAMRSTDGVIQKNKDKAKSQTNKQQDVFDQTTRNFSKIANSTINRGTILSKLSKHQLIQATKQKRNIGRYKQYQHYWDREADKMKILLNKKRQSLLQMSKDIVVEQNPDKIDILNNYIVNYWQMSLRNHNPILKQHIKGHNYGQVQLQQKLQSDQGFKQVEGSIPKLPLQALKRLKRRQLSLTGRSKSTTQGQSLTKSVMYNQSLTRSVMYSQSLTQRNSFMQSQSLTQRKSLPISHRDLLNQEQVYKISYQGDKKWLGVEGF